MKLKSGAGEAKPEAKKQFLYMDGYPEVMKSNPPVLEGPTELWRHIGSSWSSGDYPWAILGVVVAQSGAKWHIFKQQSLSLAMEPNPTNLESHHGK